MQVEPSFAKAYVAQGAAYVLQGNLDVAVQMFEAALRFALTFPAQLSMRSNSSVFFSLDPDSPHALRYLTQARDKVTFHFCCF